MNIKNEQYQVEGMTCSGCERSVQKIVSAIAGVSSAKADVNSASLKIEYDAEKVSEDDIRNAVGKIGYKVGARKD